MHSHPSTAISSHQAKDKEERLLKRQQNRERMEEKRRQKMSQQESHGTAGLRTHCHLYRSCVLGQFLFLYCIKFYVSLYSLILQNKCKSMKCFCPEKHLSSTEEKMETSPPSLEVPGTSGKEARKEKKVLEKKVAISRKRRKHSK